MHFNFLGGPNTQGPRRGDVITGIECWYDRSLKMWVAYHVDENGFQLGDAKYAVGKKDKELMLKWLRDDIGKTV